MTQDEAARDSGPGLEIETVESVGRGFRSYLTGLVLAVGLTVASFWTVHTHLIYGPSVPVALIAFAIAQMGIHLVFFLHITTGPDNTNNVLALAFGVLSCVPGSAAFLINRLNAPPSFTNASEPCPS